MTIAKLSMPALFVPMILKSFASFSLTVVRSGGVNAAAALKEAYPKVDGERVLTLAPQVILFPGGDHGNRIGKLKERTGFGSTAAVREGRVYPIDENLLFRSGPRVVEAVDRVARLLHPAAFGGKEGV